MGPEFILKAIFFMNSALFLIIIGVFLWLIIPEFRQSKKEMESVLSKFPDPAKSLNFDEEDDEIIPNYYKYSLLNELRETQKQSYTVLVFSNQITTETTQLVYSDPVQKIENRYWYFNIGNTSYKYFDTELEARLALDKFQKENI